MAIKYMMPGDASLSFGGASNEVLDLMRTSLSNAAQSFLPAAQSLYSRARDTFSDITTGATSRRLDALKNAVRSINANTGVGYLSDPGMVQWAPVGMRRFVMACPEVRNLYHQDRIAAYGDGYIDTATTQVVGQQHYDYRIATDGMVLSTPVQDCDVPKYTVGNYLDTRVEDNTMGFSTKVNLIRTWATCRDAILNDIDCTSAMNDLID